MTGTGERATLGLPALALLVAVALSGCTADPVPDTTGRPVDHAAVDGPAYAVVSLGLQVPGGSRLVQGSRTTQLSPRTASVDWLADGNVLVGDGRTSRVLDPRSGRRVGEVLPVGAAEPVVSPAGITVTVPRRLRVDYYSFGLRRTATVDVPRTAMSTDQLSRDPGNAELELGEARLAGGATWVKWYVNSENEDLTDHGVLRLEGSSVTAVSRNRPVVALTPSSDGRALLVLAQDHGDEDCGGCSVSQHIEEWSTSTGKVIADYGMPPGYDEDWRVSRMDKIGDEVVVRFTRPPGTEHRVTETWTRSDSGWSEIASLRNRSQSWQSGEPLVTTYSGRRSLGNGAAFTLASGTGTGTGTGSRTLIPYAGSCPDHDACLTVTAPGGMLADR